MKSRRACLIGIILGSLLTAGPIFGALATAIFMAQAFSILGSSGIGDPGSLSVAIGDILAASLVGLIAFPFGIALLFFSLRRYDKLSGQEDSRKGSKAICIICTVIGALIFSAPLPLVLSQTFSLFSALSGEKISDPSHLSAAIGEFIITLVVAFIPTSLGTVVLFFSLRKLSKLRKSAPRS